MSRVAIVLAVAGVIASAPAVAQIAPPSIPNLENRIPAPLPPPPAPPIINGPLSQAPPPGVTVPRQLQTHSDRTTRCLQQGSGAGLRGPDLDAYTGACANDF
jgi:hypothetical protein